MTYLNVWVAYGLWAVIIALGVVVSIVALRAARPNRSRSFLLLGVGFLLISVVAGVLWMGIYYAIDDPVMADIGACGAMATGFAAVLASVMVRLRHSKIHADDCADCESNEALLDRIDRDIELTGNLSEEQRAKLLEIADKCPVHRTLTRGMKIHSRLV